MSSNTIDHENVIIIASNSADRHGSLPPACREWRSRGFIRSAAGDTAALLSYLSSLQTRVLARTGAAPALSCCFEAGVTGSGSIGS